MHPYAHVCIHVPPLCIPVAIFNTCLDTKTKHNVCEHILHICRILSGHFWLVCCQSLVSSGQPWSALVRFWLCFGQLWLVWARLGHFWPALGNPRRRLRRTQDGDSRELEADSRRAHGDARLAPQRERTRAQRGDLRGPKMKTHEDSRRGTAET